MAIMVAESARVDPGARVATDARIGPGCIIGPDVEIGRGTELVGHICLLGHVKIGEFNKIGPFVAIGGEPQDLSYWGSATCVEIGDFNQIHERVTIHRGSEKEDGITRIGSHNRFHNGSHIAHDCKLADRITIGPLSMIGGHVHIQSDVCIDDKVGVHQFATIGKRSYVAGQSKIVQDVPCYMRVGGNPSNVTGINSRMLSKPDFSTRARAALRSAHQFLFVSRMTLGQATELLESRDQLTPEVVELMQFLESQHLGKMGRARERRRGA